jgi:hypothetical protein
VNPLSISSFFLYVTSNAVALEPTGGKPKSAFVGFCVISRKVRKAIEQEKGGQPKIIWWGEGFSLCVCVCVHLQAAELRCLPDAPPTKAMKKPFLFSSCIYLLLCSVTSVHRTANRTSLFFFFFHSHSLLFCVSCWCRLTSLIRFPFSLF